MVAGHPCNNHVPTTCPRPSPVTPPSALTSFGRLRCLFCSRRRRVPPRRQVEEVGAAMAFRAFWNSPMGPKTTHFWGPVANWGFVISGMVDTQKPPELISGNMTGVMCVFSALCMRFAWMVRPRNYLLLVCHASNESVQLFQLSRLAQAQGYLQKKEPEKQH